MSLIAPALPESIQAKHSVPFTRADESYFTRGARTALRDSFYLPFTPNLIRELSTAHAGEERDPKPFERATLRYCKAVLTELEEQNGMRFPSIRDLDRIKAQFRCEKHTINVDMRGKTVHAELRELCSKDFVPGRSGLRRIIFTYNGQTETLQGSQTVTPWDPRSIRELGDVPLEIASALKASEVGLNGLQTFSLGNAAFEGLADYPGQDMLPDKLFLDRPLTKIWNVTPRAVARPFCYPVYGLAWALGLDANPEYALPDHLESLPDDQAKNKQVTLLTMRGDKYFNNSHTPSFWNGYGWIFNDDASFRPSFYDRMQTVTGSFFHGEFAMTYPHGEPGREHACPHDAINTHESIGPKVDKFHPVKPDETVADALVRELFKPGETWMLVGGSKDTLASAVTRDLGILGAWTRLYPQVDHE